MLPLCFLLQEYADNLQGKGIHGAVMALDPSFDTDAMAKALGIPSNKHMLHRHLYEEMKLLAVPHRYRLYIHTESQSCVNLINNEIKTNVN